MTFSDIEDLVGFDLPDSYKTLIQNYPSHLRQLCEANGYKGENMLLFDSVDEIYRTNEIFHAPEYRYETLDGDGECKWPQLHLVIGASGCGDFYVLVPTSGIVKFWNHETGEFSQEWATLLNCLDGHYEYFHNEGKTK